ncbi:MAG: hypothetical protein HC881_10945, partial [Leptolyngbyaceae cyanobacterium SL_7_1]|nr:hypothetical protein [Leptolyngbyaceae cyanobacterium SL_7_1]
PAIAPDSPTPATTVSPPPTPEATPVAEAGGLQPVAAEDLQEESNWVDDVDETAAVYVEPDPEAEEPWATLEDVPPSQGWQDGATLTDTIIDVEIIAIEGSNPSADAATSMVDEAMVDEAMVDEAIVDEAIVDEAIVSSAVETLAAWIETDRILGIDRVDGAVDVEISPETVETVGIEQSTDVEVSSEFETNWVDDDSDQNVVAERIEEAIEEPTEPPITEPEAIEVTEPVEAEAFPDPVSEKLPLAYDRADEGDWDAILESVDAFRGKTTPLRQPSRLGAADEEEWF